MQNMRNRGRICDADGCSSPSRSRGYCPRHYKQLLRHGRLTPEKEHRTGCRIKGCENAHKARGYCAKHYKELMGHGHISNNGHIKDPFCAISDCGNEPKRRGLCEEHYQFYLDLYIENGYTWIQVDRIIVLYNQRLLLKRNRLSLIRERYRRFRLTPKDTLDKETEFSRITADIMSDEDFGDEDVILLMEDFDDTLDALWSEADGYEGGNLWEEKLQDLR